MAKRTTITASLTYGKEEHEPLIEVLERYQADGYSNTEIICKALAALGELPFAGPKNDVSILARQLEEIKQTLRNIQVVQAPSQNIGERPSPSLGIGSAMASSMAERFKSNNG